MDEGLKQKIDRRREVLRDIKAELIDRLELDMEPEHIDDDTLLFGGGLGLDSIDAMEIIIGMQSQFGVMIDEDDVSTLRTVNTLADFILEQKEEPVAA